MIAGLPLLYLLRFDFNPMNLRSTKAESIATYLDLKKDPETGRPHDRGAGQSLADADAVAKSSAPCPRCRGS